MWDREEEINFVRTTGHNSL